MSAAYSNVQQERWRSHHQGEVPQIFFRLSRWENLGHFSERHLPSVSELNLETLLEQGKHDTR